MYDPALARFASADSIIPGQSDKAGTANPQNLNRYSYVTNNPLNKTDPSGHQDGGPGEHANGSCYPPECGFTSVAGCDANCRGMGGDPANAQPSGDPYGASSATTAAITADVAAAEVEAVAAAETAAAEAIAPAAPRIPVVAGQAGRFGDLDATGARVTGDELTPHHMPQAKRGFTSRDDGGALVMPEAEHQLTRTYGAKGRVTNRVESAQGLSFRDTLARDIRDVRSIVGSKYNQGLRDLIRYYITRFPNLIAK